jgi:hypothetical protein
MNEQENSVNKWWEGMNLNQKQMVRLMVQMGRQTTEDHVFEVRRKAGGIDMVVVNRPQGGAPSGEKPDGHRR